MGHQFGAHANRFLGGSSKVWSSFGKVGLKNAEGFSGGRHSTGGRRQVWWVGNRERGLSDRELWKIYMLKQPYQLHNSPW